MLSLIWMVVVRLFCGLMVWVSVWLANLCFIACTIFSYAKAGDVSATSKLGEVTDALNYAILWNAWPYPYLLSSQGLALKQQAMCK